MRLTPFQRWVFRGAAFGFGAYTAWYFMGHPWFAAAWVLCMTLLWGSEWLWRRFKSSRLKATAQPLPMPPPPPDGPADDILSPAANRGLGILFRVVRGIFSVAVLSYFVVTTDPRAWRGRTLVSVLLLINLFHAIKPDDDEDEEEGPAEAPQFTDSGPSQEAPTATGSSPTSS